MDEKDQFYETSVDTFQQITKKPSHFLEANEDLAGQIKENLKKIYDFTKTEEIKTVKSNALPELVVQNFDVEQIWQQIELQNESLITRFLITVSRLAVGKNRLLFQNLEKESNNDNIEEDEEEEVTDDDSIKEEVDLQDADSVSGEESTTELEEKPDERFKSKKRSVVDDEFFKLDEMEKFLQAEEKKLNDPDSGNDSEESESEASVDLFDAGSDDDDDKVKTAKYKDFFVQNETEKKKEKRNAFLEELEQEEEEDEEEAQQPQSSYELRQSRLNKKIEEIEEEAIQEKPWQLKGEITAESRPHNSLLEEVVEFDLTSRPAPVITEQTTMQLEDIIKQRIKDKVFDSVERKAKPVETPLEYKKKLVLDQEKNKESLAQIYEREFIEQQAALDPENRDKEEKEPELHQEINSMMKSLFSKLDALSNFHFTPKPAIPELKIVSNLPAISMEEVAPVATSDAALLAPEEIKAKPKGDIVGNKERTSTDKKRERRKKKLKQKMHAKLKEKKEKTSNKITPGLGNKYSKEKAKQALERVVKDKNVDKIDESFGNKEVKSSKAFFSQLEEQVKSQIKRKTLESTTKNDKKKSNAKRLKL